MADRAAGDRSVDTVARAGGLLQLGEVRVVCVGEAAQQPTSCGDGVRVGGIMSDGIGNQLDRAQRIYGRHSPADVSWGSE
jgi:hypothetical protein